MSKIIDLSGKKLNKQDIKGIKKQLIKERDFTSITLRNAEFIDTDAAEGALDLIALFKSITSIDLGNLKLPNSLVLQENWDTLLLGIDNNSVTSLDLSHNKLYGQQIHALADELNKHKELINLNLSNVSVMGGEAACDSITPIVSSNGIVSLNLSGIHHEHNLARPLFNLKKLGKNIIELNLSATNLTPKEVSELAQGLQGNRSIKRLDISGNKIATINPNSAETSKEFSTLVKAVAASKTLEHVGLANTGLAFDGCLLFFTALQQNNNKTLVSIDLSYTPYSWMQRPWDDSALLKFEQALKWKSQTLDYLNLSGSLLDNNNFDRVIGEALGNKHNIKVLDLSNCRGFNDKVFDNLSSAFLSPSLEEVNLSSNSFNDNEKGCRWYSEEFYDRFEHHPTFVLSWTQKVHQWFVNRGYIAEMAEVAKVLHIRNVVNLVEAYADNKNPSKLFVVLGSSKTKAVISQESNNNNNNNDVNPLKLPVSSQKVSVTSSKESNDNSPNVPKIVAEIGDFHLEAVDISLMGGDFNFNIDLSGVAMDGGVF